MAPHRKGQNHQSKNRRGREQEQSVEIVDLTNSPPRRDQIERKRKINMCESFVRSEAGKASNNRCLSISGEDTIVIQNVNQKRSVRNFHRQKDHILRLHPDAIIRNDKCKRCSQDDLECLGSSKPNTRCYTCSSGACSHYCSKSKSASRHNHEESVKKRDQIWSDVNKHLSFVRESQGKVRWFFLDVMSATSTTRLLVKEVT